VIAITQDLPPFCAAYSMRTIGSLNIVGLRRAGYRQHIAPLKKAFDIFFRRQLGNRSALMQIEEQLGDDPLCMEFVRFIAGTKRGICRYRNSDGDAAEIF
jgi:UDP-N-acetylglucosamine acyltransferase